MSLKNFVASSVGTFAAAGTHTAALVAGSNQRVVVVAIGGPGDINHGTTITAVRYGNASDGWVSLVQKTSKTHYYVAGLYKGGSDLWTYVSDVDGAGASIPPTGDIEITVSGSVSHTASFCGVAASGDGELSYGASETAFDNRDWTHTGFTVDTGGLSGCTFLAYDYYDDTNTSIAELGTCIEVASDSQTGYPSSEDHVLVLLREDGTAPAGSRSVGYTGYMRSGSVGYQVITDSAIAFEPDPYGIEVGFKEPALVVEADRWLLPSALIGVEVGLYDVTLSSVAERQVMLTGGGLETPEMTTGGDDGDVLTRQSGAPPAWRPPNDHTHGYSGEQLVQDGASGPPVTLTNEAEDDWLYEDVSS